MVEDNSSRSLVQTALALHCAGKSDAAIAAYAEVLECDPRCFDALHLLGLVELQRGNPATALGWFDLAIAENRTSAAAHTHRGAALRELGRSAEALSALDRAIALDPRHVSALSNRAAVLLDQGQPAKALAAADRALALDPNHGVSLYNRVSALHELGRPREAIVSCEHALRVLPASADLLARYSSLLRDAGRPSEALRACERALAQCPHDAALLANRGHLLSELGQHASAAASYRHAHAIDPTLPYLPGWRAHAQLRIADWEGLEELQDEIASGIDAGKRVCEPFVSLLLPLSRHQLRRCAELHTRSLSDRRCRCPAEDEIEEGAPVASQAREGRLRIGYFSADFHDHPTSQLVAGVIEHHDRERFEVTAFALGAPIEDDMRARLRVGADHFVDLHNHSDADAVRISRLLGIDIAVDLGGYTRGSRSGIFVRRAAPIQVSWLGFPGTSGSPVFDYLIADDVVAPTAHADDYSEELVRLPHCYQPNDSRRQIGEETPSRAALGLPRDAFVFCCFNNPAKIAPEVFDVWMHLLRRLPDSVLWLLDENPAATQQLGLHAENRGIDPRRLIFAPRRPTAEHLARHRLADLCLDTWPYNAHTTASDALWAGVPLLTLQGATFGSRVAASLLQAVGLPELITGSLPDYESLALELGTNRARLRQLRQQLELQRTACPLFDTVGFTSDLESAYLTMWSRNLAPCHRARQEIRP